MEEEYIGPLYAYGTNEQTPFTNTSQLTSSEILNNRKLISKKKRNMRQLTEEDASHYFTSKEQNLDLVNIKKDWKKILGYTLKSDGKGWEELTYITKRKRKTYFKGEGNYYVYILSNPTIPNILKIGFTGKHPEIRAKEISRSTGVPLPYKVVWAFKCHDGHNLERSS